MVILLVLAGPSGFIDTAFGFVLLSGVAGELCQQCAERSSSRASQLLENGKSSPNSARVTGVQPDIGHVITASPGVGPTWGIWVA